ncbi:MAG: phage terminase large subunit family protein [Nitrospinae bacterium]|nr:phage terminase large subunit family protein [Nitrospinota bacterium]
MRKSLKIIRTPGLDLAADGASRFSGEMQGLARFLTSEMSTDNGAFTFAGREALLEPAAALDEVLGKRAPDRTVSVLKGAQVGMTTLAIGFALYCVIVHRLNVGYFLPDQDFADRFDQTRVRPALKRKGLASLMREGNYKGASPKGLKEFPGRGGSRFLYILGLRDIGNAISIPLDVLIRDEVDDLPPENLKWSNDRIDASPLALTLNLAVGRTPGAGIHAIYEGGDQRSWRVICPACRAESVLEENWPQILSGNALVCPDCSGSLDRGAGRWVAARVRPRHRSYRLSQLAVSTVRLERIKAKWAAARLPSEKARFCCSTLAIPDAGDTQPISRELLRKLRDAAPYRLAEAPA